MIKDTTRITLDTAFIGSTKGSTGSHDYWQKVNWGVTSINTMEPTYIDNLLFMLRLLIHNRYHSLIDIGIR